MDRWQVQGIQLSSYFNLPNITYGQRVNSVRYRCQAALTQRNCLQSFRLKLYVAICLRKILIDSIRFYLNLIEISMETFCVQHFNGNMKASRVVSFGSTLIEMDSRFLMLHVQFSMFNVHFVLSSGRRDNSASINDSNWNCIWNVWRIESRYITEFSVFVSFLFALSLYCINTLTN